MTRAAWERTITDSAGNVLTGVQIAVFQQDGTTPATIYGQLSGGAALANPFNTGVQTSAKFYADPGRYVIRAVKDGQTKEFTDVDIADKAIRDDVGTAAYLTATASDADATPGRALKVGDFGIGVPALRVADLDTVVAPGLYREEAPEHGISYSSTMHLNSTDGRQQVTVGRVGHRMAFRGSPFGANGTGDPGQYWEPWAEVFHNYNIVGPVFYDSLKSVPTGAIIERGANANGEYVKFADGTMICKRYRVGDIPMSGGYGITGLYYGGFTWVFPAVFAVEQPTVSGSGSDPSRIGWVSADNVGLGSCSPVYFTGSASVNPCGVFLIATGRWR